MFLKDLFIVSFGEISSQSKGNKQKITRTKGLSLETAKS